MATFSARKVKDYDLYSGHAWYVPGVKGMFGFIGWFLLGGLLGGIVQAIMGLFMSQQAVLDYGMIVVYPLQFLPAMVYAASQSRKNMLFDPGYVLDNRHFEPYGMGLAILITVLMTFASMFAFDLPNYWNFQLTTKSSIMAKFYELFTEIMKQMTGGPLWSSFLVVAIFAPIFEEWMCRGMVLRGLLTKMKPGWAIVVSALFFAVIHANPWQALTKVILPQIYPAILSSSNSAYYKYSSVWTSMSTLNDEVQDIGRNYYDMYDYSDARVVSADYLKLQSVSLTYELPDRLLDKLYLSRLALTLSAYNLFTICDSGLKGQTPTQGGFSTIQLSDRPSFSFGLNIQF